MKIEDEITNECKSVFVIGADDYNMGLIQLPDDIVSNAKRKSEQMLLEIGLNDSAFNVEFFWDPADGSLHLLEINPRISKSHGPLFHMVDGTCNHRVSIDLALGMEPSMPSSKGKDTLACKFMLRSFEADGIVRRVPREDELAELDAYEENTRVRCLSWQETVPRDHI